MNPRRRCGEFFERETAAAPEVFNKSVENRVEKPSPLNVRPHTANTLHALHRSRASMWSKGDPRHENCPQGETPVRSRVPRRRMKPVALPVANKYCRKKI